MKLTDFDFSQDKITDRMHIEQKTKMLNVELSQSLGIPADGDGGKGKYLYLDHVKKEPF